MDILEKMTGNVSENTACWNAVETAIKSSGVEVPEGTPKSEYGDKVAEVYEAGQKSEYDRFWDLYQPNGSGECNYSGAFAGKLWNENTFEPKYDIVPSSLQYTFWNTGIKDIPAALEKQGVILDTSKCTNWSQAFAFGRVVRVGLLVVAYASTLYSLFNEARSLEDVEIKMSKDVSFSASFNNCTSLVRLIITGTIGKNGLNLQWSPLLSKESILSIINALSTTTTELTVTFSKTAVNTAFETTAGAADGTTSQEWADLIATKSNWTISLV